METPTTSTHVGRYPSAKIPPAEMADNHKENELSLHAKVLHAKVGPKRLESHLLWLWSKLGKPLYGTLQVFALENDFFLLKFTNSLDYNMALEGGPWLFHHHYIHLRPWVPNFKPSTTVITKVNVWIRLHELPTEYYNISALVHIARPIGNLIKIHPFTENKLKFKYARICVEIDLTRPLVSHVELYGGFLQPIEYEGIHVLCYSCGRAGHLDHECIYLLPHQEFSSYEMLNQSSYGPHIPPLMQPVTGCTSGSRFSVLEQETVSVTSKKFEKKPVTKPSTSSVIPSLDDQPAVLTETEKVPIARLGKSIDRTSKLLPAYLSFLESSSASDSPNNSPTPSPRLSANDEFFVKGVVRATQEIKSNGEKVQIVEQRRPTVITMESKISAVDICLNIVPLPSANGNEHQISVIPGRTDDAAALNIGTGTICVWNCRDLKDPKVLCAGRELRQTYKLSIMVLLGARNCWDNDLENVRKKLGFSSSHCFDSVGFVDDVLILWQQDEVAIDMIPNNTRSSSNMVFAAAKFIPEDWILTSN